MAKTTDTVNHRVTPVQRKARVRKTYATEEKIQKMYLIGQDKKK